MVWTQFRKKDIKGDSPCTLFVKFTYQTAINLPRPGHSEAWPKRAVCLDVTHRLLVQIHKTQIRAYFGGMLEGPNDTLVKRHSLQPLEIIQTQTTNAPDQTDDHHGNQPWATVLDSELHECVLN